MASEPKYLYPGFFAALARRVAAATDIPDDTKELVEKGASSLLDADCNRAIESLRLLPEATYENIFSSALRDVGDQRRVDQFFESILGVSPNVPPGTTRH